MSGGQVRDIELVFNIKKLLLSKNILISCVVLCPLLLYLQQLFAGTDFGVLFNKFSAMMMQKINQRPKIKVEPTSIDKILEMAALTLLMLLWIGTIWGYLRIDATQTIPIHYNGEGLADRYGSKNLLLLVPIFTTVLYVLLSVFNKRPESFNFVTRVTEQNAAEQYANATRMMRMLKLAIVIGFCYIAALTITSVLNSPIQLDSRYGRIIGLLVTLVPTIWFFYRSIRIRKVESAQR